MTPGVPVPLAEQLITSIPALPPAAGVVVLALLLIALTAKVILQAAAHVPRRATLRFLNVAIAPLLIVFVIVVLERFRDLS